MKVEIDKQRDIIIVDVVKNGSIPKGATLYCGCCGEMLGTAKVKLSIPCSRKMFAAALDNTSFVINLMGLRHNTCKHTMFSFRDYAFMSLENYKKAIEA